MYLNKCLFGKGQASRTHFILVIKTERKQYLFIRKLYRVPLTQLIQVFSMYSFGVDRDVLNH